MLGPLFWLGKRLALISLAFVGAAVALIVYSNVGQAGIANGDIVGKYTYRTTDCSEDDQNAADPINVVFYRGATKQDLDYYISLLDGWGDHGGETQYFKTNGQCNPMDGQPSSGTSTRYHARYHRGLKADGTVDIDSGLGDYSVAAAHYEEWNLPCLNHRLTTDGFDDGRDKIVEDWVEEGGHFYAGKENWHNILPRISCGRTVRSDGDVAFIKVATGNVEGMSLSPDPANLWVCYNSPSHTCNPYYEGNRFVLEDFRNQSGIGLGGYHFDAYYNQSLLSAGTVNSSFLGSTGRSVSCSGQLYSGYTHFQCGSDGDERGPTGDGDIAAVWVSPNPQAFYVGNPAHRPTKDNGITLPLDNVACRAKGVDGVPLPGSNGDYTPVCDDASVSLRTLEGDVNLDCRVDVADDQEMTWRYGARWGMQIYDLWYDVEPKYSDDDIDIKDLQFVFGRDWSTCQNPIPCDQSGLTCPDRVGAPASLTGQPEAGFLQGGTNVVMDPPSQNVPAVGQQFTVDLQVSDVTNPDGLGGYQFTLQFDPSIVSYVGLNNGSFLGSTGSEVVCQPPITDVGMVSFVCNTSGWESQRPSGSGQLARATFQTVGEGFSPLNLSDVILVDPPGEYITAGVADGSASVGDDQGGPVGGIAEYPEIEPAMAATTPGSSAPDTTALAGSAASGVLLLTTIAWYARRTRWRAG